MSNTSDDGILRVDPAATQALNAYRAESQGIRTEIGNLEIRKYQLIGRLGHLEQQAQATLQAEAARLGLPKGTQWSVTPEGVVHITQPQPHPQETAPASPVL